MKKLGGFRHRVNYFGRIVKGAFQFLTTGTWDEISNLTERNSNNRASGSRYKTYAQAVAQINRCREGRADYGKSTVNTILSWRSAFILGAGIEIAGKNKEEIDRFSEKWVEEFLLFNGLDSEGTEIEKWVKELESEGKILLVLFYEDSHEWEYKGKTKKGMISVKFLTWSSDHYTVVADPNNYSKYIKVKFKDSNKKKSELKEEEFVYEKIGGLIDKPNTAYMTLWGVLEYCENLDMALEDLRSSNHLHATPKPEIEVDEPKHVGPMQKEIDKNGADCFEQGKIWVHYGKAGYLVPDLSGTMAYNLEIENIRKKISGDTGVPLQLLGHPEAIKNRSQSDEVTREGVNENTKSSRKVLIKVLNQVLDKARLMYQKNKNGVKVNLKNIDLIINTVNEEQWERLKEVFMPQRENSDLSRRTLHELTPGIDPEKEQKRLEEESSQKAAHEYHTDNTRAEEIEKFKTSKKEVKNAETEQE